MLRKKKTNFLIKKSYKGILFKKDMITHVKKNYALHP